MTLPDLSHLAVAGTRVTVRVTATASHDRVTVDQDRLRVHVTASPEAGKANAAVQRLLAKALGLPFQGAWQRALVEECVEALKEQGYTESEAWAICQSQNEDSRDRNGKSPSEKAISRSE